MIPVLGTILAVDGPAEGPSADRTYTVRWYTPGGEQLTLAGCATREYETGETLERRAFAVGFAVAGALTNAGAEPRVLIMDREDYAVGCT